ncbi:MAG: hypothetical protein OEW24_06020 [Chloroflexota bacterium]|nr:hypothetical protein [Chloroflexota bacterium]
MRPTLAAATGMIATALILLGSGAIALRMLRAMRAPAATAGPTPTASASI